MSVQAYNEQQKVCNTLECTFKTCLVFYFFITAATAAVMMQLLQLQPKLQAARRFHEYNLSTNTIQTHKEFLGGGRPGWTLTGCEGVDKERKHKKAKVGIPTSIIEAR